MTVKQKTHIKHLFALKPYRRCGTIDLAVLTDSNQYIEYTLKFKTDSLTKWVGKRIRSLFEPYLIDKNTDIVVCRGLDDSHPLYLYFMLLHQHIKFRLHSADLRKIANRVHYFYAQTPVSKATFNKAWQLAVKHKHCPWITQEIDYAIQNKGPSIAMRIKTVRLAMLYIVIKNHLYRVVQKSMNNKPKSI